MVIQLCADFHQDFLAENGLHDIDCVLGNTGQDNSADIQAAVEVEQLQFFKMDGLIDDPLLHLQGKNPEEETGQDDEQQDELQEPVSSEDPVEQGPLGN